jgi:hypothetical protein
VSVGCSRNFLGMNRNLCEEETTQLYQALNVTASRVWLVEPLVPGPPRITAAAILGGAKTGVLTLTLTPPVLAGYFAISSYSVLCLPAGGGPNITAAGMGRNVGVQVMHVLALPVWLAAEQPNPELRHGTQNWLHLHFSS